MRGVLTPVDIGHNNGESAEILSGIAAGVPVILFSGEEVRDGSRVQPR